MWPWARRGAAPCQKRELRRKVIRKLPWGILYAWTVPLVIVVLFPYHLFRQLRAGVSTRYRTMALIDRELKRIDAGRTRDFRAFPVIRIGMRTDYEWSGTADDFLRVASRIADRAGSRALWNALLPFRS